MPAANAAYMRPFHAFNILMMCNYFCEGISRTNGFTADPDALRSTAVLN